MKRLLNRCLCLTLLLSCLCAAASQLRPLPTRHAPLLSADAATRTRVNAAYGQLPLSFESNRGQADPTVKFLARGSNYHLALTSTAAAVLGLRKDSEPPATVHMQLIGAHPAPQVEGLDALPGQSHYLLGNDPQQWRTNVATYARVRYVAVYPGVDLIYYGNGRQLEYDFVIAPGAKPEVINIVFAGAQRMRIDANGDLLLHTAGGEVRQRRPVVYQEVDGARRIIAGRYVRRGRQGIGFQLGAYDARRPVVIDPVLLFIARGFGGTSIAVDPAGNAYVAGSTTALDFATVNPLQAQIGDLQSPYNGGDAFITKLNPAGTAVVYSTYLGGIARDEARSIAVDAAGNAYITGETQSGNFPATNTALGGRTLFKSTDGGVSWNAVSSAPPLYGISAIAVDPTNPAIVYIGTDFLPGSFSNSAGIFKSTDGGASWRAINAGLTSNVDRQLLPIPPVIDRIVIDPRNPATVYAIGNGVVFKSTNGGDSWSATNLSGVGALAIDPTNSAILYAAALGYVYKSVDGGSNWSQAGASTFGISLQLTAVAVDLANPAIVYAGGVFQGSAYTAFKSTDGGNTWRLLEHGPRGAVNDLVFDPTNSSTLYVSTDAGVFKTTDGGGRWSVNTEGLGAGNVRGLVIDPANPTRLYAATSAIRTDNGVYKSADGAQSWQQANAGLPQTAPAGFTALALAPSAPATLYAGAGHNTDVFVTKLNPNGSALGYSTLLGGNGPDEGHNIAVDAAGNAHVTGVTQSVNFPTTANAFQQLLDGAPGRCPANGFSDTCADAFVAKLDAAGTSLSYATYLGGSVRDAGAALALDPAGGIYVTGGTRSRDFPVKSTLHPAADNRAEIAFVTKLDATQAGAASLVYSTYLNYSTSPSYSAQALAIAVDAAGQAHVAGNSYSLPINPLGDSYVVKLNAAGTALVYTHFGPALRYPGLAAILGPGEAISGLALDAAGNAYVTGHTTAGISPDCSYIYFAHGTREIPIPCTDVLLKKLSPTGVVDASFPSRLGGSSSDYGYAIAVDAAGNVYVTGGYSAPNFAGRKWSPGDFIAKIGARERPAIVTNVSAASYAGPTLASEAIIAAFGPGLSFTAASAAAQLPTLLAGTQVKVRDSSGVERLARLFFVSSDQINYEMPAGLSLGAATVSVISGDATIATGAVQIAPVAPGLFTADATGRGLAAAVALRVRSDGSQSYEPIARYDFEQRRFVAVPIDLGATTDQVFLLLFGTGLRNRSSEQAVSAMIGGVAAPILYAGTAPPFIGLDQINARLPRSLAGRGEVDVVVMVDGKTANTVKVSIK